MNAIKILIGALMVLMALGGSAMAAQSSSTQVSATLSPYISLAVPDPINNWILDSQKVDNSAPVTGLQVNSNAPWQISVQTPVTGSSDYFGRFWSSNAWRANFGYMANGHDHGFMTNALVLNAGFGDVTLSDDQKPLASGTNLGNIPLSLTMKQTVLLTDPAESDYKIVIQFTYGNT